MRSGEPGTSQLAGSEAGLLSARRIRARDRLSSPDPRPGSSQLLDPRRDSRDPSSCWAGLGRAGLAAAGFSLYFALYGKVIFSKNGNYSLILMMDIDL